MHNSTFKDFVKLQVFEYNIPLINSSAPSQRRLY